MPYVEEDKDDGQVYVAGAAVKRPATCRSIEAADFGRWREHRMLIVGLLIKMPCRLRSGPAQRLECCRKK